MLVLLAAGPSSSMPPLAMVVCWHLLLLSVLVDCQFCFCTCKDSFHCQSTGNGDPSSSLFSSSLSSSLPFSSAAITITTCFLSSSYSSSFSSSSLVCEEGGQGDAMTSSTAGRWARKSFLLLIFVVIIIILPLVVAHCMWWLMLSLLASARLCRFLWWLVVICLLFHGLVHLSLAFAQFLLVRCWWSLLLLLVICLSLFVARHAFYKVPPASLWCSRLWLVVVSSVALCLLFCCCLHLLAPAIVQLTTLGHLPILPPSPAAVLLYLSQWSIPFIRSAKQDDIHGASNIALPCPSS